MSNNQYNPDGSTNYVAPPQPSNTTQQHEGPNQYDAMREASANPVPGPVTNEHNNGYQIGQPNTANTYNNSYIPQNQPVSQPSYTQNQMNPAQGNYSQERAPIPESNNNSQPQSMPSNMMNQPNLPQNQPPIGQRNYSPYPQPSYGGAQGNNTNMSQSLGGINNSSGLGQNYMHPSAQSCPLPTLQPTPQPTTQPTANPTGNPILPPVSMNTAPGTFQTSQGEKTYEPSVPISAAVVPTDPLPVSLEVQREFEEKSAR
jgi:hypothetical protein